ncbi:MAG: ADP-forming succinate--CoA ligase subunit beta [Spirochaetaceae bacterium]|nr:MAG: ADP-forming succinate--CoA ligase subunit beta [Spirochaetaceae bacterium]
MNVQEYQGKELFKSYGIPVQDQIVVTRAADAREAAEKLGGFVVVKAQVLVGGRGKAGGVKLAKTPEEAEQRASDILKLTIKGIPVEKVLIVPAAEIRKEYYLSLTMDRTSKSLILIVSAEGGVDIEELAVNEPEKIKRIPISIDTGVDTATIMPHLKEVFGTDELAAEALDTVQKLFKLYTEKDCSLLEINPYAIVDDGHLMALDSKVNFDDNALFKHDDIQKMKNPEEDSADEAVAKEAGLSFVSMDGDIGCMVNGAGLAMATMDIIKLYGGEPANFLDVGGSSNPDKVVTAMQIITGNPKVKSILINIFGGITRCDDIANGLLTAMKRIDIQVPMVVRLIGTNEVEGRKILTDAGFEVASGLSEAVEKVVKIA